MSAGHYYHDHSEEMARIEAERERSKQRSLGAGAKTLADLRDGDGGEQGEETN